MGIWSFWLFLGVAFLVAEIFTLSTVCLYVGIGALCAMVSSWICEEWHSSIITFVIATTVLYLATYGWRRKIIGWLHNNAPATATGMDALIGRSGRIMNAPDGPRLKIDGDVWKVESSDSTPLNPGDNVKVVGYDSIILKVEHIFSK